MFVSVVVPVRNEREHLAACLEALLSQDYAGPLEVLVVDGRSTDGTREIIERFPVLLLTDGGVSVGEARNLGIAEARGEVVAFTDGDCIPDRGWVSALVARFVEEPELAGVGGGIRNARNGNAVSWFEGAFTEASYRGFITSNVAYRRDVLLEVGGFDPAIHCGEDWDLYWRVLDHGYRVAFEPAAVVTHAPVENRSWRRYVRKQFWYARTDMACFGKRAARIASRVRRRQPVAVRSYLARVSPAILQASAAAGLAAGALGARRTGAVAAGAVGAWAVWRTAGALRHGLPAWHAPAFVGLAGVKGVLRGAGGLAGLADLAWALVPRPGARADARRAAGGATPSDALEGPAVPLAPWERIIRPRKA